MKRMFHFTSIVFAIVSLALYGCSARSNNAAQTPSGQANAGVEHGDHGDPGEHDHGDHSQTDMDKMNAELAKLSPEDAASAEKQHFCPVSGEMLGTMGAPLKIDVKDQQVWICCEGCKDRLVASPDEYLAKLKR